MNTLEREASRSKLGDTLRVRDRFPIDRPAPRVSDRLYVPITVKYVISLAVASLWTVFSVWLSLRWVESLSHIAGLGWAIFVISFIAYFPGFMQAFLLTSILLDRRPLHAPAKDYPPLTILVAAYNEEPDIADTLRSLAEQKYPADVQVLVMDDGSTDATAAIAQREATLAPAGMRVEVISVGHNRGKAAVLNHGLELAAHELVITVDGDSYVYADALRILVERYLNDPPSTRAVAGAVLVRNSRATWITRAQEWDYFHGIAAVKRMQSMYQGTLVAQGAFSLYEREALKEVGGWPPSVGEDIVVSWAMLKRGWRIGYSEDAVMFTHAPESIGQFARQRQRWSRGMIEAFKAHPGLLFKPRLTTLFVWWNALFVPTDLVYTFAFIPGIFAALVFGWYEIAGPMTLLVLPLAAIWNLLIFRVQKRMFKRRDLSVRQNIIGFLFYLLVYSMVLQPVCVWGYVKELVGLRKGWGTK